MTIPFSSDAGSRRPILPSPIFLSIVALAVVGFVLMWSNEPQVLSALTDRGLSFTAGAVLFVIASWIVSLCLHEFGHALAAHLLTSSSHRPPDPRLRGYLSLDPRRYVEPQLTILLPVLMLFLGGFGLPGGAVYLRLQGLSAGRRTTIALAGPAANLLCAAALLIAVHGSDIGRQGTFSVVAFAAFLQVTAAVLNLLPVPGLDGWAAASPYFPPRWQQLGNRYARLAS